MAKAKLVIWIGEFRCYFDNPRRKSHTTVTFTVARTKVEAVRVMRGFLLSEDYISNVDTVQVYHLGKCFVREMALDLSAKGCIFVTPNLRLNRDITANIVTWLIG